MKSSLKFCRKSFNNSSVFTKYTNSYAYNLLKASFKKQTKSAQQTKSSHQIPLNIPSCMFITQLSVSSYFPYIFLLVGPPHLCVPY